MSELGWCHSDDSSFLDLERSSKCPTACFLRRLSSPCTLTHTSPTFNHLLFSQYLIWLFVLLINLLLMITHACLKAWPSAFCQANPEYVSVKFVSTSRSLSDQLVCSNEWTTFFTCHSSAMLPSMVMIFDCSCHPTLNDASMIRLSRPSDFHRCGLRSNSWLSGFYINITAWKLK